MHCRSLIRRIDLQINSSVEEQFAQRKLRTTILHVLARYNVRGVQLNVDDKGALDCILRARTGSPAGTRQRYPGSTGGLPMISALRLSNQPHPPEHSSVLVPMPCALPEVHRFTWLMP